MGIGGFFNWVSKKYPSVVLPASKVNMGFDNLYLDMNGIIHICSNPPNKPALATKSDLMAEIAKYIDRLMTIVKPRKLLFISMDGRSPRAKNNKERQEMLEKGLGSVQTRESSNDISYMFFMKGISQELCRYIDSRVSSSPSWKGLAVMLSDAEVPGEGEHKIVEYIRRQRVQAQYNANMKHCLFSVDADAIILGLTTHEPMFTILKQL
ncbi:hypothetical protein HELRODRAFT_86287, partial [Helobdella robusta]|uniref:Xrn1 N-terminal domain-containing protein n=1 Tax=Helobdella robusta TaxID=6412 RepID=T1G6A0_HELRO